MRKHTALAATVVFGLALLSCGTSAPSGPAPASTSSYCTLYGATNEKIDAAYSQISRTASAQVVHSALDTIVSQVRTELDSSPPAAIKSDLQIVYNAVVEVGRQFAAVSFDVTRLPSSPPAAVNNPAYQQAANNLTQWAQTNCGTPTQTGSPPPAVGPTR